MGLEAGSVEGETYSFKVIEQGNRIPVEEGVEWNFVVPSLVPGRGQGRARPEESGCGGDKTRVGLIF